MSTKIFVARTPDSSSNCFPADGQRIGTSAAVGIPGDWHIFGTGSDRSLSIQRKWSSPVIVTYPDPPLKKKNKEYPNSNDMMGRFLRTGFCMAETCQQFTQLQPRKRLGDKCKAQLLCSSLHYSTFLFSSLLGRAQNTSCVNLRKTNNNSVFNTCHRLSHNFWNATVKGTVNVSHRLTQGMFAREVQPSNA